MKKSFVCLCVLSFAVDELLNKKVILWIQKRIKVDNISRKKTHKLEKIIQMTSENKKKHKR
jgi:hypothetical protein